jgi:tetratricopeptide (TPR) repeat protein
VAEDERTRRWERLAPPPPVDKNAAKDPLHAMRNAIAAVRKAPADEEARRRLRALATEQGSWDQLALLLSDEARAAVERPDVAAALYEELADVYENQGQSVETIEAMEAVVALQPKNVAHHDRLAWLYRRAGATVKAAQAFEQVAKIAQDERGRAALRAAGKLYRDAGRLDQAAHVYRAILERRDSDVEAWRSLEEVLTDLKRWREVAAVRGKLAERVSGVDKAVLLRAQARAMEQAGEVSSAADLVAAAAQHAPDDVSGLVDYATVLAREGRAREAADVLTERIAEAVSDGAPSANIAALRFRLAETLEACGDQAAADAALDKLIASSPEYVPALEKLAKRAQHDPRAHAAALLRQASAINNENEAAALVIEAARRLREAGELRAAIHAFERAAELLSEDDKIIRELDEAKTALAVEVATANAAAGDSVGAERTLRAILADQPLHLAANFALADLLSATGRLHAAAHHLRGALGEADEYTAPETVARLVLRTARVTAALGDTDEAHQLLHEAHHLSRRDLQITLALGESCFARKLWREAAIHLGSLADHPDAPANARAVALGLTHAGQAEVRALKPANAAKHYEAAVRVDPSCGLAWHALAELAIERDDMSRAAECLEREAAAATDVATRVRLYDALGDLALDILTDPARAERYWRAVEDAGSVAVLEKLLILQRKRGAVRERGETCERLSAMHADPRAAKELTEEAIDAFAAAGEGVRARALADALVSKHPMDLDAIACASRLALDAGDHEIAAGWLRRALQFADSRSNRGEDDPRRADMWRRLGDAEKARKNERAALEAYQRAVKSAPESEGALAARRGLIELAASFGRTANTSRLALVEAEQDPTDVISTARELAGADRVDEARSMYELARAIGVELLAEDERFLDKHPQRSMASDEAYASPLDEAERRALIDDEADKPLAELLAIVGESMQLLCPDAKAALDLEALSDARRLSATSESATVALYPQIANALGGSPTLLYVSASRTSTDLRLLLSAPPVIVLSPKLAQLRARSRSDSEEDVDLELRFRLGRYVELARPYRVLAAGTDRTVFERFVAGLIRAFGKATGAEVTRDVAREAERLHQALPVATRRRLSERMAQISPASLDADAYLAACERAADRAGLLACGHPGYAIHLAGGPDRAKHLVALAASQKYLAAQRKLRRR